MIHDPSHKTSPEVAKDIFLEQKDIEILRTLAEEWARRGIRDFLDQAGGQCHIEMIMKDVSTVMHDPRRLWEWERFAWKR